MILIISIIFLLLSVYVIVPGYNFTGKKGTEKKGFYQYLEPRFKVDSMPRGCVAR